ncbi:MAG TPA: diguanylate cyclase [Spirochaetales bacterium]|nr:diguanylate cyclase [Spirochaetales bacterium]HRY55507.1 diguanylate cyclase [Spirochaetia bacterium]
MSGRVEDFLATLPLFESMGGFEVAAVAAFLEPRSIPAGSLVFREGESGTELYFVRSGRVGSYVTQADGSRRDIYEFGPGALFGEMAIIEREPRSATCYAKEDSELLVLAGDDFYRLVWDHPVIAVKLLGSMARVMVSWLDEASGFLGGLVRWGEAARRRAVTDELTGLFNRRFLEDTMRAKLAAGSGSSRRNACLMLDIDHFRRINAAFGAQAGDATIAAAAAAFAPLVREGEVAARLSGDEFAFFIPDGTAERGLELAEAVRAAAASLAPEYPPASGGPPEAAAVSVSVGVALSPEHGSTPEELVAAADRALYAAKEGGRNRVALAGA